MITIVTVYREGPGDHLVMAIEGTLTPEQAQQIGEKHALQPDDAVSFCEVELIPSEDVDHVYLPPRDIASNGQLTRHGRDLVGL